jgi:3-dehydroquinate synthase
MIRLTAQYARQSHDILIARRLLDRPGEPLLAACQAKKALIVTDANVAPICLPRVMTGLKDDGIQSFPLVLPAGEDTKQLKYLSVIYHELSRRHLSRADALITLGGGVIGDLGGFAAATYLRGIPYMQAPTTLLAQTDSSVGGKVAINLPAGKNLAGSFYHPSLVLIDTETLETLPDRIFTDGLGEIVKYACIYDADLFAWLERHTGRKTLMSDMETLVARCLTLKIAAVRQDERDTHTRAALNFGHTLGHAIETAQHYTGLRHGEAICAGMALITRVSQAKGLTDRGTSERLNALLMSLGLPVTARTDQPLAKFIAMDKKASGARITCVILKRIGEYMLYETDTAFLKEAARWLI